MRSNRLDERVALFVGVVAGSLAATAGARPTGSASVDVVLVALAVAIVTWAAASAPWWAVAVSAAIASVIAIDPAWTLVGAGAFVAGLWIGVRRQDLGAARAVIAGISLNVLVRSELGGRLGTSAALGVLTALVLLVAGVRRRHGPIRRVVWTSAIVIAAGIGVALIGFALSAASARSSLTAGDRAAREGIVALDDGDFATAAERFGAAASAFGRADHDLGRPWARIVSIVPVVAQNADAVGRLAATAASSTDDLAGALAQLDPERLRLTDGRIDVTAFADFAGPLASVQAALTALRTTVADVRSPWLVAPLDDRMTTLDAEIADNETSLENAALAVDLVPDLLGRSGPRRYFVAFTTPAEARGAGGFMGNYAEFVAEDGQLALTAFGRTGDLNAGGADPTSRRVTAPAEWVRQWGRYGFVDAEGTTGLVPWSNIAVSPHFPSTAQVIAELYPQSGGTQVDGVFAMDPYVLAALVQLTGPIDVPTIGQSIDAAALVPFLLQDQYRIDDRTERVDLLEDVARETVARVLGGSLPAPTELAAALGDLTRQGRLVGWSTIPAEQDLFERIGFAGGLPDLAGDDGVAVIVNNAAANKIDVYLERTLRYQATVDVTTGQATGTLDVTLTNTAPTEGLPQVVIGNAVDEPAGSNRSVVSIYTALPVTSVTVDGEPTPVESGREEGWVTSRATLTIPAGASRTISLRLAGGLDVSDGYALHVRPQALVAPEVDDLLVVSATGDELVAVAEEVLAPRRIEGPKGP